MSTLWKRWLGETEEGIRRREPSPAVAMLRSLSKYNEDFNIGPEELKILSLFYDRRFKVRRYDVPLFFIYATLCDEVDITDWATTMAKANLSINKLERYDYIVKRSYEFAVSPSNFVSQAAELYGLSAKGLEKLREIKPPVALRLRGWIAVLPPWVTMTGTIASGIAGIWGFIEWSQKTAYPFLHNHHIWRF